MTDKVKSPKDVEFETIPDGDLVKWEKPGVKVVGVLKSFRVQKTANGDGYVAEVKTSDGVIAFFCPSLLKKKMEEIAIGNIVSIEYTEQTKTISGNPLKHFDVGVAKPTPENLAAFGIEIFDKVEDDEHDQPTLDPADDK